MPSESFPVDRIERTLRQQLGVVLFPLRAIGLLRTLLLPLAVVASLLLALPALSAAENTISGTVSLPDGRTATEDMYIDVYAETDDYVGYAYTSVYILAGAREVTYTLTVPSDASSSWRVYYSYYGSEPYLQNGYYSTAGTQPRYNQATLLPAATDHSGINLVLLTGNTISGTVALPDGRTAPDGGLFVWVYGQTEDYGGFAYTPAYIMAGAREGMYNLTVPSDASASWRVYYSYSGVEPYVQDGYYSTAGTKPLSSQATLLATGTDHINIDLTLLTGNTISGTVSMPDGRTSTEDMSVTVYAQTEGNSASASATAYIAAGASEGTYTLTVPSDATASWLVYYSYWYDEAYLQNGYYSTGGTQWQSTQASFLTGGQDYANINLILLTGNTISGTVSLPDSRTATEDMYVDVSAQTTDYSSSASATAFIPAGASEGTYTLTISPDTSVSWRVEYSYGGDEAYYYQGYYNATIGTQPESEQATILPGGADHSGIDLTLLIAYTVSGTVSLPDGHKAPEGGLEVIVYLVEENGSGQGNQFFIPAGESSVDYSLSMPADTTLSRGVEYHLWETTGAYLARGYYSKAGTQWQLAQATFLPGGQDHAGINLTLLTGATISGTVSLPNGRKAPAGGLAVEVYAQDSTAWWQSNSTTVVIPENATSVPYALALVPDPSASWEVSCSEEGDDATYLTGYYNTAGTTWFWEWATLVPGGADRSDINLNLLIGKTISGTVSLPAGHKAPTGGISLSVILDTEIGLDYYYTMTEVSITEEESSAVYTLTVPDDPQTFWHVQYYLDNAPTGSSYLNRGYYSTGGTQWRQELATLLSGADHANINLPLLVGNTISGTVTLPEGLTAPEDGLYVEVSARNESNYSGSSTAFIPAGGNSVGYAVPVPIDADLSWEISYSFYGAEGTDLARCLRAGYYSVSGTLWRADLATLVPGGANRTGIDLDLLLGKTISGTVSRPSGQSTDSGVFLFYIIAENALESFWSDYMEIESGASSTAYSVIVPADATAAWTVRCYCLDSNYLRNGYYSASGTQWRPTLATPVQGGIDQTGIDLNLLVGTKTISGTISLPGVDSRGQLVYVYVSDRNDLDNPVSSSDAIILGGGMASTMYSLSVPADADVSWTVWYQGDGDDPFFDKSKYIIMGYYNTSGTQWRADAATPLAGGDNWSGIDMVLLRPTTISGTVFLPTGQTAPAGGTAVSVQVSDQTNMDALAGSRYVTVPGGKAFTDYSVLVPIDASALWAVRYSYDGAGDYLSQGYYSSTVTQPSLALATFLSGGAPHSEIDLTLLVDQAVNPDTDADLLPDAWEITHFGNLTTANGTTDYDRDGYTDLQEYLNEEQGETDPLGAEYDPKQGNAPGGTGYISISSDEGFWEIMTPVIINSAREAAGR